MLPKITLNGLECGYDGSTNLSIREVQLSGSNRSFEIVCNTHKQKGNYLCSLKELRAIIEEFLERSPLSEEQKLEIINKISAQISTSKLKVSYDADTNDIDIKDI